MSIEFVICAAGRGTRLEFEGPKTLYPIGNRTILEWILDELPSEITSLSLVCSPVHLNIFREFLKIRLGNKRLTVRIVEQPYAIGTADAVYRAISTSTASHCLIAWGDQIGLVRGTFNKILEKNAQEDCVMVLPLIETHTPYVNFEFNEHFEIIDFNETKKTGIFKEYAHTDCGTFLVKRKEFTKFLELTRESQEKDILENGECNILNLFQLLESKNGRIAKVILFDQEIRTSINSPREAMDAESYIQRRVLGNG
jgi:bifunctional N-acetylglucosamine-1-phosphate-uridyltransferase/glucosamine-1-phosphate-acetyltransferase GlmU-like protein